MASARAPLVYKMGQRDPNDLEKDSKLVNCYQETYPAGTMLRKRPGLKKFFDVISDDSSYYNPRGIFNFKNRLYVVIRDKLYSIYTDSTGTIHSFEVAGSLETTGTTLNNTISWARTENPIVFNTSPPYDIIGVVEPQDYVDPLAAVNTPYLVFHDGAKIYIVNFPTAPVNPLDPYEPEFITTGSQPPNPYAKGLVYLNGRIYVMDVYGRIYNCNDGDPNTWDPLNFIAVQSEPDSGIALAKHLNYIVAFGSWSTEFFYDAGNAIGSPLSPQQSMKLEIGCASGDSVVEFEQTVVWIGQAKNSGRAVYSMVNGQPQIISDLMVENLLNSVELISSPLDSLNRSIISKVRAWGTRIGGHTFYYLTLLEKNVTIVYDFKEKQWHFVTSYNGTDEEAFKGQFSTSLTPLGLSATNGYGNGHSIMEFKDIYVLGKDNVIYTLDTTQYQDDSIYKDPNPPYAVSYPPMDIRVKIVTPLFDNETTNRKYVSKTQIVGDMEQTQIYIRHTDDDYQTWSNYRQVNMSNQRPALFQCGATRRRAWEISHYDDCPLRLAYLELDVEQGVN